MAGCDEDLEFNPFYQALQVNSSLRRVVKYKICEFFFSFGMC